MDGTDFLTWQQNFGSSVFSELPADFNSDGIVDSDDLGIWEDGFGTTDVAEFFSGDSDMDSDVDGNDFLAWQQKFGSTTASGLAAISSGDTSIHPRTIDSCNGAFMSKDEPIGSPKNTKATTLSLALAQSIGHAISALQVDLHGLSFESLDFAGSSLSQPISKTNGNTLTWLDLPQFRARNAFRPSHRDQAVDTVMSR